MTREDIAAILLKLRVASGGRGATKPLGNGWEIGMFENADSERPYQLVLKRPDNRVGRHTLRWSQVYTKGRSPWRRDNVIRLKDETVTEVSSLIEKLMRA